MSITELDKIDFISINQEGRVVLTISDHLGWEDEEYHLRTLQDKINKYVEFIESGQIYDDYPFAKNKNFKINVVSKFEFSDVGNKFIRITNNFLKDLGISELTQTKL